MYSNRFGDGGDARGPSASRTAQPRRRTPWNTLGGRVISLVSRKGGVGKTTSAVNLGAALALSGHTVLVVGVDAQCGVCRSLGCKPHELPHCLTEIFGGARLSELAQPSPLEDLFFVSPRILSLAEEETFTDSMELQVMDFVREIDRARSLYDTILIDCPPSLGPATRAALLASDSYLVPVQAEELCRESLDSLLDFVDTFRERNFPGAHQPADAVATPLALEGLFLTMDNRQTRMGRHVAEKVREDFGGFIFTGSIPRTVRLSEMALRGKPTVIYDRRSAGSRAYFDLADELVSRYSVERPAAAGTGLPRPRPEPARPAAGQTAERFAGGGLEKLLRDLGGNRMAASPFDDGLDPEMVSLDDLLAEEERGDEWGEDSWMLDTDPDRYN